MWLFNARLQGSWSEGSDQIPQVSQAEQEYAAKLERERTLRHTLQALQENKAAEAKSAAAKMQKKVTGSGLTAKAAAASSRVTTFAFYVQTHASCAQRIA